jgi:tetratricopeptide (TPR) repeat protein
VQQEHRFEVDMAALEHKVFLSHNSDDKDDVKKLALRLNSEDIKTWLDEWNLIPGKEWQPAIEQALEECTACAVFIGKKGFGPWQHEEMRAAIDRRVSRGQRQYRVIPVLLPGADRPEPGKLPAFLRATTWVEFRRSLDDMHALHRLVSGIRGVEPGPGPDGAIVAGECPYRGLEFFDVEHERFFFGREAETEWLVNELRPRSSGQENRFLAILGASGSGKSSLARAGLIAGLRRGALEGSSEWPIVICRPGRDPIESLAVALAGLRGGASLIKDARDLLNAKSLGDDPKSLHIVARLALRDGHASRRLVVLVDQLEEAFTLCENEAARRAFFDILHYAGTVAGGQTIVIVTIRADFYGKCGPYPALAAAMSDHQHLVGPMAEDELRRAIERPAVLAGGEFEPWLVGRLLQDVAGQAGALPLLQFTLMELWQRREGRRMTEAAYRAIGGLQGALKNRADEVLGQFDDARRDLCRRIFLRLTQPGEGSEDTKRRSSLKELVPIGTDPLVVEAVVNRLADARLITTEGSAKPGGEVSVEVAHEALIRGWGRLREWVDADRAGLLLHRQLAEAAREWQAHNRESSFLYRGTRLTAAREWVRTHRDQLNDREAKFLDASKRRRRRAIGALAASIALVLGASVGAWAYPRWTLSRSVDRDLEEARKRSLDGNQPDAIKILEKTQTRLEDLPDHDPLQGRVARALELIRRIQHDQLLDAVRSALDQARKLSLVGSESEAIKVLEKTQTRLQVVPDDDPLRRHVAGALESYQARERDSKLIAALEEAPLAATAVDEEAETLDHDPKAVVSRYRQAFRADGIDVGELSPDSTAAVIRVIRAKSQKAREALAATLDDWAWRAGPPEDNLLREIARQVDPDAWRNAIRDAEEHRDTQALQRRASDAEMDIQAAVTLHRLGSALTQAGAARAAVHLLRRAQQLHPHDFRINCELADAFTKLAPPRYDEAIRYCSAAVALRPNSASATTNLGFALSNNRRMDEAIEYYNEAIRLNAKYAPAYNGRGLAWYQKKEYDKAIADYDKAIRLNPSYAWAFDLRGNAYRSKLEYERALGDYDEAVRLSPRYVWAYYNRGRTYSYVHQYVRAIVDLTEAIRLDPNLVSAYTDRGNAYRNTQEYEKAIDDYNEAIRLDSKRVSAYTGRAIVYSNKHEYDKAVADSNEAIRLVPAPGYANRGHVYSDKREYDKAIADYNVAIRLDPKRASAYIARGQAYSNKHEYDKAIADCNEAIRLEPKYAWAYCNRGNTHRDRQQYEKAIADYEQAIRLDPRLAAAYVGRGNVYIDRQQYDKAIASYNEAIRIDPKFVLAYKNRGNAFRARQQYDAAVANYNEAIRLDSKIPEPHNAHAWLLATCPDAKYRDGKKAVESATRACELSGWKSAAILDTLAAACAETGDFDAAVKWQQKALNLVATPDDPLRKDLEAHLRLFQAKKPYRDQQ